MATNEEWQARGYDNATWGIAWTTRDWDTKHGPTVEELEAFYTDHPEERVWPIKVGDTVINYGNHHIVAKLELGPMTTEATPRRVYYYWTMTRNGNLLGAYTWREGDPIIPI